MKTETNIEDTEWYSEGDANPAMNFPPINRRQLLILRLRELIRQEAQEEEQGQLSASHEVGAQDSFDTGSTHY